MINTAQPVLESVSADLREMTTDTGTRRLAFFNKAVKHVLGKFKWVWSRKTGTLTVSNGVQTYNLKTSFTDFSTMRGIYKVYINGTETLDYSMSDDGDSIIFTNTVNASDVYTISYYQQHINVTSPSATLNISLPEEIGELVGLYMLFLEHRSKKQRNDARNAMIDFTDKLDDLRPQDSANKGQQYKKVIPNFLAFKGFRRVYRH